MNKRKAIDCNDLKIRSDTAWQKLQHAMILYIQTRLTVDEELKSMFPPGLGALISDYVAKPDLEVYATGDKRARVDESFYNCFNNLY
jgi:hypothetical protein